MASTTNRACGDVGRPAADGDRAEAARLLDQLAYFAVRHLSSREISFTTASTLGRLARLGPHRLTALASREGATQPSMTQLVQRLERQGLVTRTADPDDGRAVLVDITDDGRTLIDERRRDRQGRLADLLATLPPEDEAALAHAVRAALPALEKLARSAEGDATARADRTAPPTTD